MKTSPHILVLCIITTSSNFKIPKSRQLHDDFILVKGLKYEVMGLDIHSLIFLALFYFGENILCL